MTASSAQIAPQPATKPYNVISVEEASALRYALDDADFITQQPRHVEDRLLKLWRRLHLWLMLEAGDTDALEWLQREFPDFSR